MSDPSATSSATAPPNLSYLLHVLNLDDGKTEDDLDETLKSRAKKLGVSIDVDTFLPKSKTRSVTTCSSSERPRRSESIDSRASQSTGLTSIDSERSRSHHSTASLSCRDYDAVLTSHPSAGTDSWPFLSTSPPTASAYSLPLSPSGTPGTMPKRHFRRIRGLGKLMLNRNDSAIDLNNPCPHCPPHLSNQRSATHNLPCGHCLCTQALRQQITAALSTQKGIVSCCCHTPIPGHIVGQVMTQEEQNNHLTQVNPLDDTVPLTALPSLRPSRLPPSLPPIPSLPPLTTPIYSSLSLDKIYSNSRKDSLVSSDKSPIDNYLNHADYQLLLQKQSSQRDCFLAWTAVQHTDLTVRHERLRDKMRTQHEIALDTLTACHNDAIAEAEDCQIRAEADLRDTQQQECRDTATALRHIEAYCAGVYVSNGNPHGREITSQGRKALVFAKLNSEQLSLRHQSAVNVLRGEQMRRIKLRAQRQDKELQELKMLQKKEELELERCCTAEMSSLEEGEEVKRRKIQWRWELEMAIWAAEVELHGGGKIEERLPTPEW